MTAVAATGPGHVFILCPTTGEKVSAVLKLRPEALEAMRGQYAFRCPQCGEIHQWVKEDAWLESMRQR